jgi:hypothetical protein
VNNSELLPSTEVKVNDTSMPLSVGGKKIEDLKSQCRFEEKNFAQTKRKLLTTEVDYLLCDYNFIDYERTLNSSVKGLVLAQEVANLLVEQLAQMKLGMGLYFEPFPMSKLAFPSNSPMTINVQTCLVCDELFLLKDICTRSCDHTYHLWCLLVQTLLSRKCKVVNCDEEFNAKWCYSFGLSKLVNNMFSIVKKEEATTKLGSEPSIETN